MIQAIGDLSKEDKEYLTELAKTRVRILEGGVGASTQLLTHYTSGEVVTYDTDPKWISRVRDELFPSVGVEGNCTFLKYHVGQTKIEGKFDLVFVDLEWAFRLEFAMKAWHKLGANGKLIFHDARRSKDISNIIQFVAANYREISMVEICPKGTNMAVLTKSTVRNDYENWQKKEGLTPKQLGIDWLQ